MRDGGASNRLTFGEVCRTIFRTSDGLFLVIGAAFVMISLFTATIVLVVAAQESRLLREGEVATARVVARRISTDDDDPSYRVYYEFVAADGRTYGNDFSVDRKEYYALAEGAPIEIRYAARDPFDSAVVGHRSVPLSWVLPVLGIFVAFGSSFLIRGARGLRRRLQVLGKGLQVWGKKLGIREDPSGPVINDQPCRVVEFEYIDHSGRTVNGHSACLSDKIIARLQGRDTIPIVYLVDRPENADLDVDRL